MAATTVEVAVIGGGFAGLSGALTLARARRGVVVIDEGKPRNAPAAHSHGYLTRDGVSPLEILAVGQREVTDYGVEIINGTVSGLERLADDRFRISTTDGADWEARRVLVATGLVDELPDIPGLHERWGRDVVHCPFCFGWEMRDMPVGMLATGPQVIQQTLMWRQWTPDLIVFLHREGPLAEDRALQLAAQAIQVVPGEVVGIEVADDHLKGVRLSSGKVVERSCLVVAPRFAARHAILDGLGVKVVEHPLGIGNQVQADATGCAAPGVWVAGNVVDVSAGVVQAAASGVTAAAAINFDLSAQESSRAMTAMREVAQPPAP